MVEAELRSENSEVSLMDSERREGTVANQPTGSSEDRTNLDTASWKSEHLVNKVGSMGGKQLSPKFPTTGSGWER